MSLVVEGIEVENYLYHCPGAARALSPISKLINQVLDEWMLTWLSTRVIRLVFLVLKGPVVLDLICVP